MSQWDFGYGREPSEHHEPPYSQQPPYSYPSPEEQEAEYPYGQGSQDQQYAYPQEPQYQYPEALPEPQYPPGQQPQYPYPHEAGWPAADGYPEGGEPSVDGHPGGGEPYDPPTEYPITYERDEFEGRAALPSALPPEMTPPYRPWPDPPDPGDRFGAEVPASPYRPPPPPGANRFGSEPAAEQWRPPSPVAELGSADRTQVFYPSQEPSYPPAYRGTGRSDPSGTHPDEARSRGGRHRPQGPESWPPGAGSWPPGDEGNWRDQPSGRRRWLIPVLLAVAGAAVGAAIVMFALGHARVPSGSGSPTTGARSSTGAGSSTGAPGPAGATGAAAVGGAGTTPLTLATARSVLSAYTTANNSANARRSSTTLATVETGGSFAIDAGLYTVQAAEGAAPFPAFAPVTATYYIPQAEPADATRWFVVLVGNAFSANPKKVTSTEYLLFTQAATGGPWQNAVEPYLLAGTAAPQIAVSGGGFATAVSATATSLAVAPGQLAERTAAAIDGTGSGVADADQGALADRSDQTFWRGKLPTATVTDAHAAATGAAGQTFALQTTNGGALVFYTDAADLEITPPAGSVLHLTVPGFYSSAQALSRAGLSYLDQFAAVDPQAGSGTPRVVAQYSGLTGKN